MTIESSPVEGGLDVLKILEKQAELVRGYIDILETESKDSALTEIQGSDPELYDLLQRYGFGFYTIDKLKVILELITTSGLQFSQMDRDYIETALKSKLAKGEIEKVEEETGRLYRNLNKD